MEWSAYVKTCITKHDALYRKSPYQILESLTKTTTKERFEVSCNPGSVTTGSSEKWEGRQHSSTQWKFEHVFFLEQVDRQPFILCDTHGYITMCSLPTRSAHRRHAFVIFKILGPTLLHFSSTFCAFKFTLVVDNDLDIARCTVYIHPQLSSDHSSVSSVVSALITSHRCARTPQRLKKQDPRHISHILSTW